MSMNRQGVVAFRLAMVPCFAGGCVLGLTRGAAAQSGGLALTEDGGPINGTAQAGSAAVARDAQTAWLNPAGMVRLEKTEVIVSAMPFLLQFDFNQSPATTTPGTAGGDQGGWFPGGAVYIAAPMNDNVWLGFSITGPAGLGLDPDNAWVGRYFMTKVQLAVINIEPSLGIKINDQWSVGGGMDVQYAIFKQELAVPTPGPDGAASIDGDSWNVGFSLSTMWQPSEKTRFGARYRSEINHNLSGDMTLINPRPISTGLTIPRSLTFSGYHDINDQWAIMGDLGWQDWSSFDRTIITFDGTGAQVEIPRNFKDTWTVSAGAHYKPHEDWLIMFGTGYTSSAVSDANRTPDLPVDEQIRLAAGLEWKIDERWSLGANYTFLWLGENKINQTRPTGSVVGDYDAMAHLFGIYASVRF